MTGKWKVGAVLLDMDGTLLDTERVYFDSLVAALQVLRERSSLLRGTGE